MIDPYSFGKTPEELQQAIKDLRADFEAHNHDGSSSKKFESIEVGAISAELIAIRKLNYGDSKNGLWAGIVKNVMKLFIGSPTNYLSWDGTTLSFTGKSRQTLKVATVFEASGRFFIDNTGSGASSMPTNGVRLTPSSSANSSTKVRLPLGISSNVKVFNNTAFSAVIEVQDSQSATSGDNGTQYIGVKDTGGTLSGLSFNISGIDQYGFKIVKTNGVTTLYSTSSNAAGTETTAALGTIVDAEQVFISAVCDATNGTVSFHASSASLGSVSSTHTTNIPTITGVNQDIMTLFSTNLNTAFNFRLTVGSYTFEQFSGGLY